MYKWPKQTHPDGDNNWLICYLPLRWQMLDIFSFCLSYWERSCNYLFCKKSCPWHLGRLLSRLLNVLNLFSLSSYVAALLSLSRGGGEGVTTRSCTTSALQRKSGHLPNTAGRWVRPTMKCIFGMHNSTDSCFGQKITFLYKYFNIDTPKVRIRHLNARNFSLHPSLFCFLQLFSYGHISRSCF